MESSSRGQHLPWEHRGLSQRLAERLADDWRAIDTPAFVYDTRVVRRLLTYTDGLRQASGCKVLFSLKPFAFVDALALMAPHLDGFATSSLFEARLTSQVLLGHGTLHLTTPGMRPDDVGEIASLCDFVSFNSLSQYRMHGEAVSRAASCGLRVNPQMSFVDDERYDPCRPNSKLGVPLERLVEVLEREPHRLSGIDGILVHSNCDSSDLAQAQATVQYMHAKLGSLFERVSVGQSGRRLSARRVRKPSAPLRDHRLPSL